MDIRSIEILLVDDDPATVDLTKEVLKDGKILVNLNVVKDGTKALEYLRRQGPYQKAVRPDMIFLDLNLPKVDGREVLKQIKMDEALKLIPVLIMSTSDADVDVSNTYNVGCNCYIIKPINLDQFTRVIRSIEDFWFTLVKLPTRT